MFTIKEKVFIAEKIQELLKGMQNPQLPSRRNINFHLHINGIESHAFCDIHNITIRHKHESPSISKLCNPLAYTPFKD